MLCRESRIGDACFFIEKVLDQICEFDGQCAQFVLDCRKKLWPDYHEMEAKRDEERERQEAEEKKRRAKVLFFSFSRPYPYPYHSYPYHSYPYRSYPYHSYPYRLNVPYFFSP